LRLEVAPSIHGAEAELDQYRDLVGLHGIGLGYVTPMSTVTKWFPDKKGHW
jgi:hypothetical protein